MKQLQNQLKTHAATTARQTFVAFVSKNCIKNHSFTITSIKKAPMLNFLFTFV